MERPYGGEYFRPRYDWPAVGRAHDQFYREVVGEQGQLFAPAEARAVAKRALSAEELTRRRLPLGAAPHLGVRRRGAAERTGFSLSGLVLGH